MCLSKTENKVNSTQTTTEKDSAKSTTSCVKNKGKTTLFNWLILL